MEPTPSPVLGNVFDDRCPSRQAFNFITERWTPLVICALSQEPRRYNRLRREVRGVSPKMLTQALRRLEESQLVTRTVRPSVPPEVEYALTPLGESLVEPLRAMVTWAERHHAEMLVPPPSNAV